MELLTKVNYLKLLIWLIYGNYQFYSYVKIISKKVIIIKKIKICFNLKIFKNRYAMGTAIERHASNTKFYMRGDTIPGILVDGNNYFAVTEAIKWVLNL